MNSTAHFKEEKKLKYEWDEYKSLVNKQKHKVSFEEAATVFDYPLSVTFDDPDHSMMEKRELTIGYSIKNRLLIVSSTIRKNSIRIISVRLATKQERKEYEEGI